MILICFCLSIQIANAQTKKLSIKVGEAERKGLAEGVIGVVGTDDDGFYVLRMKSRGMVFYGIPLGTKGELYLDYYSNNLVLKKSAELENITMTLLNKSKGKTYEFFAQDDSDNLYIYYSNKDDNVNNLYKSKINAKSLNVEDAELVRQFEIKNDKLDRRATFSTIQSEDKSKMAIFSSISERKSTQSSTYVEVFDASLNSLWHHQSDIPQYEEGKFRSNAFSFGSEQSTMVNTTKGLSLSNDGVLNLMSKVYEDSKKGTLFGGRKDYMHLIYAFAEDNEKPVIRSFANKTAYIVELMIQHSKNDQLRLAGYYSNEEKFSVDGVMFLDLNPTTLETNQSNLVEFNDEQIKAFLISSNADPNKKARADKKLKKKMDKGKEINISARNNILDLYTHDDNSLTLAGEYFNDC